VEEYMVSKHWTNDELGTHNYASEPHYNVHINGKVDINPETGKADHKIELHVAGMYRMVKDWLGENHMLSDNDRATLIDLIASKGKRLYNPRTKQWEDVE
jgi:hypothetical protein